MAFGSITPWQTEGEKVEAVTDFLYMGSKVAADGDCSHAIERHLLLGRRAKINLDSVIKTETLLCLQRSVQSKLWFFQ